MALTLEEAHELAEALDGVSEEGGDGMDEDVNSDLGDEEE
jgi:NTP pyrophosphatase (non-canonical NTP hydrolase)